jgi:hypothetical protein
MKRPCVECGTAYLESALSGLNDSPVMTHSWLSWRAATSDFVDSIHTSPQIESAPTRMRRPETSLGWRVS